MPVVVEHDPFSVSFHMLSKTFLNRTCLTRPLVTPAKYIENHSLAQAFIYLQVNMSLDPLDPLGLSMVSSWEARS